LAVNNGGWWCLDSWRGARREEVRGSANSGTILDVSPANSGRKKWWEKKKKVRREKGARPENEMKARGEVSQWLSE
ncbi:hypothetical protein HAX54_046456, partial [Datura stramonium]|nr:hypothetical protein [Datura stramonium]